MLVLSLQTSFIVLKSLTINNFSLFYTITKITFASKYVSQWVFLVRETRLRVKVVTQLFSLKAFDWISDLRSLFLGPRLGVKQNKSTFQTPYIFVPDWVRVSAKVLYQEGIQWVAPWRTLIDWGINVFRSGLKRNRKWKIIKINKMAHWFHRNPLKATVPVTFDLKGQATNGASNKICRFV